MSDLPATRADFAPPLCIKWLGQVDYPPAWEAMRVFTETRSVVAADEIWLLEHPPVYTLGQAGQPEHLLDAARGIELVRIDRGGQITYHGPGQLVVYLMIDLARRRLKVREFVFRIEAALIDCLATWNIAAERRAGAPGVYVGEAKIAALGLRIRNGRSYHGLALNVDMDLAPFGWINPCGYPGLQATQLRDLGVHCTVHSAGERLLPCLLAHLA